MSKFNFDNAIFKTKADNTVAKELEDDIAYSKMTTDEKKALADKEQEEYNKNPRS